MLKGMVGRMARSTSGTQSTHLEGMMLGKHSTPRVVPQLGQSIVHVLHKARKEAEDF